MRGLILTDDDFEEAELLVPYYRLQEVGLEVDIAAPRRGRVRGEHGYPVEAGKALADVAPLQHDVLVIPGGPAAEALSDDKTALKIAAWFIEGHRPVAAICHGPLVLVATGLIVGPSGGIVTPDGVAVLVLSSALLALVGWLPGTAQKAWSKPAPEL